MVRKFLENNQLVLLFVVSAVLLFSGLDKIDVNIMEARNFISAREMVQNKEYLLTTLNNIPRYEKPPLPTWMTAVSGVIFGFDSLFAMRLPVVLITLLLVFVSYYFSKNMGLSPKQSLNNGLILITTFYIFFSGRDNQWDMYTHSFMMVSIYFLWKLFQEDAHALQNSLLSGLFLGCSILSKGPVSFYAMFLPFLISYGIVYRIPFRRKGLYLLNMLLSGLAIGISWYLYVRLKDPESFKAIATRETSNWTSYEIKPFYYYWSFFLQSGLWAIPSLVALIYPYLKNKITNPKAYKFALLWTVSALIFLSAIPEKKVRYLVPVLIPLALTTGFYIEYLIQCYRETMDNWEKRLVWFESGLIAIIGLAYPFALAFFLKKDIMDHMLLFVLSSVLMYGCAFFIVKGLLKQNFSSVFYGMIGVFTVAVIALVPLSKVIVYNPEYASASKAQTIEKQYGVKTYSLNAVAPEIVWDFGKPIPLIQTKGDQIMLPDEDKFALMVDKKDSATIKSTFPGYNFDKIYRINLFYKKSTKDRLVKDYYILTRIKE